MQNPAAGLCRLVTKVARTQPSEGVRILFTPENTQIMRRGFEDIGFFTKSMGFFGEHGLVAILCCGDIFALCDEQHGKTDQCLRMLSDFRNAIFRMAGSGKIWRRQLTKLVLLAASIGSDARIKAEVDMDFVRLICFRFLVLIAPALRKALAAREERP